MTHEKKTVKPFLKWAGGKNQLLPQIARCFPYKKDEPFTFIEPFIGSGAVLFWVLEHFPLVERVIINDLNTDLINTYKAVALAVDDLVWVLKHWEKEFHGLASDHAAKQTYYYEKRAFFNERSADGITHAALFIFLNRTCFNGLYRVNRHNQFNVPMGSYKKPTICDEANLRLVNKALEKVKILNGDFEETLNYADKSTFFYFDPPYKPLNVTSSFNAYASNGFDDEEQTRLKIFCDKIHAKGHQWMLSNSDVKTTENASHFFDDLYADYHIERVKARRAINSVASKRGELNELLITNYRY
ncbi:MAG: DNA adenine methylase [Salinivirgaceae bacterium]